MRMPDFVILIAIAACTVLAARSLIRRNRRGGCVGCSGCAGSAGNGGCCPDRRSRDGVRDARRYGKSSRIGGKLS